MSTPRTQSLRRAIELLHAVAVRPQGASASELARATGLPRSTVTRMLATLADAGFVEHVGDWVLGYELVRLARAADPYRGLVEAARGVLARLRDDTGESALLAVTRGRPGIEIVLQLDPARHVGVSSWVGVDVPMHSSAAGKLALAELERDELEAWLVRNPPVQYTQSTVTDAQELSAELERVRRRGWAEIVDELEDGLTSLAMPVRGGDDSLVALVGISGPTFRLSRTRRRVLLPRLQSAAIELEATAWLQEAGATSAGGRRPRGV